MSGEANGPERVGNPDVVNVLKCMYALKRYAGKEGEREGVTGIEECRERPWEVNGCHTTAQENSPI